MNNKNSTIKSPEHLLAQLYAMKCDSADRLQDLIDTLQQHHNKAAADIFLRTLELIQESIKEIELRAQGLQLPSIPPWEIQWQSQRQADCQCIDNAHYLMSAQQAIELALSNERGFHEFFKQQISDHKNNKIIIMGNELYQKEKQITEKMNRWREQLKDNLPEQNEDLDPPNIPE